VTAEELVDALAAELGVPPPDPALRDALLRLASVAAHGSERRAAPIATYLAGVTGRDPDQVRAIAERIAPPPAP
jgi:hypothetical protein